MTTRVRDSHDFLLEQVTYEHELARYYMWAQTNDTVFIACHVPTGKPGC